MRTNVTAAHAKGLAVLLAMGLIVSSVPGAADAKAKKPKLSATKVTVTVGKTKKIKVKNANKVTWTLAKKAKKIVKLSKKSKKGATIKGLKKGSAKISVKMKAGKKTYKKTIKVTVKAKKKPAVTPANNGGGTSAKATPTQNTGNSGANTTPTPTATAADVTATATATATADATATATSTATATPDITPEPTPDVTPGPASGSAAIVIVEGEGDDAVSGSAVEGEAFEGDTVYLKAAVTVSGCAVAGDIVWTTTNQEVATVEGAAVSGTAANVVALKAGKAYIQAKAVTDTGIPLVATYTLTVKPTDFVLTGEALGDKADYQYVPNGAAQYQSVGIFAVDKSKLTTENPIVLNWTATNAKGEDVKGSQGLNIALKNGDQWNSGAIADWYGRTGGTTSCAPTADQIAKIDAEGTVYMHVSLSTAGFDGTCTLTDVTVNGEAINTAALPDPYTYVEAGLGQYAPTARVDLPADFDFSKYKSCKIEFEASDMDFEFHGIVSNTVDGQKVEDPKYGVNEPGVFVIDLNKVKTGAASNPYVVINAGQKGYAGSVKITKVTFILADE